VTRAGGRGSPGEGFVLGSMNGAGTGELEIAVISEEVVELAS
jgi:hypothetical protein